MRFTAVLAAIAVVSAIAAEPPGPLASTLRLSTPEIAAMRARAAQALLRGGQVEQALAEALAADRSAPGRAELATLLGNIYFRKADFREAERCFRAALALDTRCAEAYLGLGRLDQLQFRRRAARERFRQAYGLQPESAAVVRAYASVSMDPDEEIALLRQYLAIGKDEPREQLESALGHLEFHRNLGTRQLGALASPYQQYRLRLNRWTPRPGASQGLLLEASVNGSKPLRLVLDTGAAGIFLHAKAAAKLGLEFLSGTAARGVGDAGSTDGARMLAARVRIGELELRNCLIDVTLKSLGPQVDGVIGASVFQQFVLQLDARRQYLDLVPYAGGAPALMSQEQAWPDHDRATRSGAPNLVPVFQLGHLLLVNTILGNGAAGYLVLDTGAAYTSLSRRVAEASGPRAPIAIEGAGGARTGVARAGAVRLRIAGREVVDPEAIAFDFGDVSNREGVEISGLIGYPVLSRMPLTIDYRDGLIGFDSSK